MANLFSVVCGDRTKGNGHKLEHTKSHTNMRRNFYTVRVAEHWNRLPREAVDSPSLEIFKTCLDAYLCSLLQGACFGRGVWTSMVSRGPFQPLQFCDPVTSTVIFELFFLVLHSSVLMKEKSPEYAEISAVCQKRYVSG